MQGCARNEGRPCAPIVPNRAVMLRCTGRGLAEKGNVMTASSRARGGSGWLRRALGAATLAAALAPVEAMPPAFASGFHLGVFSGGFDPKSAAAYEAWLGRPVDFNVEFLSDTGYSDFDRDDGTHVSDTLAHTGWLTSVWRSAQRPNMLFSVPLSTRQDPSLAHVAAGRYDERFADVARTIARAYPNAIIRIGWEMNGDWYTWSAAGQGSDYVAAFRRVAALFRQASAGFTIDWCPTSGASGKSDPEVAYPGDDAVDVIGLDLYNDYRYGEHKDDPKARWTWLRDHAFGLAWQARFAAAHHKRMSLPEWGVNRDDPYFIEQVHAWLASHDYAYAAYWDSNSAFAARLTNGQYPRAAAVFRKLFGRPGQR